MALLFRCALLAPWLVTSGCSFLIEVDGKQCRNDSECVQSGLGVTCDRGVCASSPKVTTGACGSAPACAKTETCFKDQCAPTDLVQPFLCERPKGDPSTATVSLTMHIRDYLANMPVSGLVIRACPVADVLCQAPVATAEDGNGSGDVTLKLPFGFAGFLDVNAKDIIETMFYFGKPLVGNVDKTLQVVGSTAIDGLAALVQGNVMIDRSAGIGFAQAFDCNGKAAGGIHFEASKTGDSFFLVNGLPSLDAQVTVRDEATNGAGGGFFNLEPGFAVFTARLGMNGPKLGEYNAQVRASGVTSLEFYP